MSTRQRTDEQTSVLPLPLDLQLRVFSLLDFLSQVRDFLISVAA